MSKEITYKDECINYRKLMINQLKTQKMIHNSTMLEIELLTGKLDIIQKSIDYSIQEITNIENNLESI